MGASVFFQGANEIATLSNTFQVGGVATDPTAATLAVTDPNGVEVSYTWPTPATLSRTGTGAFTKDIPCSEAGEWQYVWTGTVAASDVVAGTFTVFETALGKLYATVQALKSRLGIPLTSTSDDYELHAACFAASRLVEQDCQRHFWRTLDTEVRTFTPDDLYCLKLPPFSDLVEVATLKTDTSADGTYDTTWASTDYQLQPVNPGAAPETRPYTRIQAIGSNTFPRVWSAADRSDSVQVTGVFGWPAVPWAVRQATLIVAAHTFRSKDAPLGVAGFGDTVMRVQFNRSAETYLAPYRRVSMLVA